jgi:hypothetical protein
VVNLSGPKQSGYVGSTATDGVSGALPIESNFLDGAAGSRVKDTLVFNPSLEVGSFIVILPDGATQVTVVTTAGESANDVATSFWANLPSGWSATAPVNGNLTISGPYQTGCQRSTFMDGVTGALPVESDFVNGQVGVQAITDTLTFGPATNPGTIIVTLPDGTTKVTLTITSAPKTAVQVASLFQSALPSDWKLVKQVGGAVTFSGPDQSGQPSTAIDLVSGALPDESGFKDGSSGSTPVKDTLTFNAQSVTGTIEVTLPDGAKVTVVKNAGESANAVATAFINALPSGWTSTSPVSGTVTITGPAQSGYSASTATYVVSGAAPLESGFNLGDASTPTNDTLTFFQSVAVGTFHVILPNGVQVVMVTTAGESANAIATDFVSKLPSPWSALTPVGGTVKIYAPFQSNYGVSYAVDYAPTPPTESGFQNGNGAAAYVSDTLTFHIADNSGKITITLPDKSKIDLDIIAGESANAVATAFINALPSGWTSTSPVSGTVTITGPAQSGYSASTAIDVVSGALPLESSFVNGRSGVQGVTDTLTFGPATNPGTIIVTLPDGTTKVTLTITSAPKTAVQVASLFQSSLPSGWDLISQIGNVVTFSGPVIAGQPSTAIDGVTGALPVENGFVDGVSVRPVADNLAFSAATAVGTITVTLPDGSTEVSVTTTAGESANDVATAFSDALAMHAGWSATVPVGGNLTIFGPAQNGFVKSTVTEDISGALPSESGLVDGTPIASVTDNLSFNQAIFSGSIVVTLPDRTTNITINVTAGESANDVATAFSDALAMHAGWSATVPVGGNVTLTGPAKSGCTNSIAYDIPSGATPTESGFIDGNSGKELRDTLTFSSATGSGIIIVTLPDGTKVPVAINGPKTDTQVASSFSAALPSGWRLINQIGNAVTFATNGSSGIPSTAVEAPSSGTTATIDGVTKGVPGIPASLPSWSGATTGFIKTWADLEAVLLAQGSVAIDGIDSYADNPLNVYYRTDNSDIQDLFLTSALNMTLANGTRPSMTLDNSIGADGEQSLIDTCMNDRNGIGFGSIGSVRSYAGSNGAQVCSWNGVSATDKNVIDSVKDHGTSQYALWQPLILVTNGQPNGDIETFINWLTDPSENLALARTAGFTSLYETL